MMLTKENKIHECKHSCLENRIEQSNHLHGITCSLSCNHEQHLRTGFAGDAYVNFSEESIFDQLDDKVKKYIDQQATLFETPLFN